MDKNEQNTLENSSYTEKHPRFLQETGVEAQIASIILPVLESLDYQLVRVKLLQQNGLTLQIMAERLDHSMKVEDCEILSNVLSPLLDAEDPISQKYHLEISSPGIDRPLVRVSDFSAWQGNLAKIELLTALDGKKRYKGIISGADEHNFTLIVTSATEEEKTLSIPYQAILTAKLILTDDLIRDTLAKDKAMRI